MDPKLIKARREQIERDAPCVGCGSTLAACKAQRGKDPTAPLWFGCCARGVLLDVQCVHVPDQHALRGLLLEIERGQVRNEDEMLLESIEEFPLFSASRRGRSLRARVMATADDSWPDDVPMDY